MALDLALLVLLSAFLHASWNAIVKMGNDPLATQALVFGTAALLMLLATPFLPLPPPAARPFLLGSVGVHLAYLILLAAAYRHGDLSLVYPIARGVAPMLVAGLALVWPGEMLSPVETGGVVLVSAGIVLLAFSRGGAHGSTVALALATGITIAVFTLLDGLGARRTGAVAPYLAWLFVLQGIAFSALAVLWRGRAALAAIRTNWRRGVPGGLIAVAGYGIAVWAMTQTTLAPVAALRESGVIMAAAMGTLWLGEPFGGRRILAAAIVFAGVVALAFAT